MASSDLIREIRRALARGNALTAHDLATRALETDDSVGLRYRYLLSLAAAGSVRRALTQFEALAPAPAERNEDWLALPARLHKDLAFRDVDPTFNLSRAAKLYADAFARTGGAFSGINAATTSLLSGRVTTARQYARAVLALPSAPQSGDLDRYYTLATTAEAALILGDLETAKTALNTANTLIRDQLATRARTRQQLQRIVEYSGLDERCLRLLELPDVYRLKLDRPTPDRGEHLEAFRLQDAPVTTSAPRTPRGWSTLSVIADLGAKIHMVIPGEVDRYLATAMAVAPTGVSPEQIIDACEQITPISGFLPEEDRWLTECSDRLCAGLAALNGQRLGQPVRRLFATQSGHWLTENPKTSHAPAGPDHRAQVGLVFTDFVGFSTFSEIETVTYWTDVVPKLAAALKTSNANILLQQTWGDALHIVTDDADSASRVALLLIDEVQTLRGQCHGKLRDLEIRVGVHFAPAHHGFDAIAEASTYFGSQLSFAARVEPVTPPGMAYVTEHCAAELALSSAAAGRLEYAGEIALSKQYGRFRLYALN